MRLFLISLLICLCSFSSAQDYAERFDTAWRLVNERYWNLEGLGVDWQAQRDTYEPLALAAGSDTDFYQVLTDMYAELGDDHSVFVPPERVAEIRDSYGDLPCLGVFSQADLNQAGNVSYELRGEVGYIKVPDLASNRVGANLRSAVGKLESAGASSLVLDLRGNPGGRLVEMMQAAGIFTSGFLWRTVTNWTLPIPYPALGSPETELPLVVLIDSGVNSAAEGLAGALQQRDRATIIGETSAGNVEAVLPFCLRDGSQAWIATGVLAPIGAATWEGAGVIPDIETSSEDALKEALNFLAQTP